MIQDDLASIFSYDGQGNPDTFSLRKLSAVVNSHFNTVCRLEKLAEGGYHKVGTLVSSFVSSLLPLQVYEIVQENGSSLGVVRVASPAFPKDKLESEVISDYENFCFLI